MKNIKNSAVAAVGVLVCVAFFVYVVELCLFFGLSTDRAFFILPRTRSDL